MCIDDLLKILDSTREACMIYHEMNTLFADSGFTLTKWPDKSQDILEVVPEQHHAHQAHDLGIHSFQPSAQVAMGLK